MAPKDQARVDAAARGVSQPAPIGVIDIGSNSIRLVVFQGRQRSPIPLFNEKVLCAIGRHVATTGLLDKEGLRRARACLSRFRRIALSMGVGELVAVATAAVREASNGAAFVAEASALCGIEVRVLSGEEEAALAAEGVLSGIPQADGLVGDLGGGSLELTEITGAGRGHAISLPLGPLRLMDTAGERMVEARAIVDKALEGVPWLKTMAGRPLYAVGGVWRSLARLHMRQRHYPLHILQNYEITADDAIRIAKLVSGLGRRSLQAMTELSRRRLDTVPYGAMVLERLTAAAHVDRVVISAFGLREGLLFNMLNPMERALDPLVEFARARARTHGRHVEHGEELIQWTDPLFADEAYADRRLRMAAAYLSDTQWSTHPDYRAEHGFLDVQRAQFAGINHSERAFLALCVFHRYGGAEEGHMDISEFHPIAGDGPAAKAVVIGAALRLGHTLSASVPGILPRCRIERSQRRVTLVLPRDLVPLAGESVRKRLALLATSLGLGPHVTIDGED